MPHTPLDLDWEQWDRVAADYGLFEDTRLWYETYCDDWNHIYHVSLWEDYNHVSYPHISLLVTEVKNYGDSIWKQTSHVVGDSENTEMWPTLDRLFGSRHTWQDIIEDFRAYLIDTEPEIYLHEDDDFYEDEDTETRFGDENVDEDGYIRICEGGVWGYAPIN